MTTATKTKSVSLGVRMPQDWNTQLLAMAAEKQITRNDVINQAIARYLAECSQEYKA